MLMYTPIMATLQKRVSRGHTYWSIVESRRVNGKPRPVILEYLGTADTILKRLQEGIPKKVRSWSHGLVAVMLNIAEELEVVEIINKHVGAKQIRDGFTVGGSLLLAALGRICQPTSKRNWHEGWARHTSLSYLTRMSLNRLDSQHFWDQMDALPTEAISLIEEDIVKTLVDRQEIALDTLLLDASNFFTYIDSANERCNIAQRGHNKQKRMDLRQFGLLLLVSDQGNNSKETLLEVNDNLYFIGAMSPHHHKDLIARANGSLNTIEVDGRRLDGYRKSSQIWGLDLTAKGYVSR